MFDCQCGCIFVRDFRDKPPRTGSRNAFPTSTLTSLEHFQSVHIGNSLYTAVSVQPQFLFSDKRDKLKMASDQEALLLKKTDDPHHKTQKFLLFFETTLIISPEISALYLNKESCYE
ncbi:hypothetical protein J6590_036193 [Homalodisca vitripennis]|nr:hypothetical protein J6590_036193 [Homalodisca vitripennis]